MPHAHFELVPGGHAAWLDDAEAVAERIRGFVAGGLRAAARSG
jgi:hypothetical protein